MAEPGTERTRAEHARVWRGFEPWLLVSAGAAALLLSVAAHRVPYFPSDVLIARSIQAADLRILALPLQGLNTVGFPPLVQCVYGGIVVLLFLFGKRWEAAAGVFGAVGSAGINHLVKYLVDRPRPTALLVHVQHHIENPSYPAGHVLNFTVFAGFLCCVVWIRMHPSWRRSSLIALLLAMIALMGVARIDSGEHWPSDVLGGYLLGAVWLAATVRFYDWGRSRFPGVRPTPPASGDQRRGREASSLTVTFQEGT